MTARDDARAQTPDPPLPSREELVAVVREAAQRVRDMRGRSLRSRPKGDRGDLVTEADEASERLLARRLRELGPPARILSEEAREIDAAGGAGADVGAAARPRQEIGRWEWVVDPLDGTVNYAGGRPWYGVSVALRERGGGGAPGSSGTPLAATCWPEQGRTLSLADGGALDHLTDEPPRVSGREALRGAAVSVVAAPYLDSDILRRTSRLVGLLLEAGAGLRIIGCGSFELGLVATGRMDGFVHLARDLFSTAAMLPIVEAAGGRVTGTDGEPTRAERPGIVATNGRIHDELLELVGSVGAAPGDA